MSNVKWSGKTDGNGNIVVEFHDNKGNGTTASMSPTQALKLIEGLDYLITKAYNEVKNAGETESD